MRRDAVRPDRQRQHVRARRLALRQVADEGLVALGLLELVADAGHVPGPVERMVERAGDRLQLARGHERGCRGGRGGCRRDRHDLPRADELLRLGGRRVVDLDLVVGPREGDVDVRRGVLVVERDRSPGGHPYGARPLGASLGDGECARHRIRADGQLGLLGSDCNAVRQVAEIDLAVRRLGQLVRLPRFRTGPVDRALECADERLESTRGDRDDLRAGCAGGRGRRARGRRRAPLSRVASQTPSPAATPIAITAPRRIFGRRLDAATAATLTSRADVAVG